MERYLIENIQEFKNLKSEAVYLVLFHVDKQPPHLGVIVNEAYYSLRFDKMQIGIEAQMILKTVQTKKIPTLLFEVDPGNISIDQIFQKYLSIEGISCLYPIREYFYPENFETIQLVFDLLDRLKKDQKLINTYWLNLEPNTTSFSLMRYSMDEVQKEIKRLQSE